MRFDAVTLFPEMFDAVLDYGITRRALDRGLYRFKTGFGGREVHRPGCWDVPYRPLAYAAYAVAARRASASARAAFVSVTATSMASSQFTSPRCWYWGLSQA